MKVIMLTVNKSVEPQTGGLDKERPSACARENLDAAKVWQLLP